MAGSVKSSASRRARQRRRGESETDFAKRVALLDYRRSRRPYQRWEKKRIGEKRDGTAVAVAPAKTLSPSQPNDVLAASSFEELATKLAHDSALSILSMDAGQRFDASEFSRDRSIGYAQTDGFAKPQVDFEDRSIENVTTPLASKYVIQQQNSSIDPGAGLGDIHSAASSRLMDISSPTLPPTTKRNTDIANIDPKTMSILDACQLAFSILWLRHAKHHQPEQPVLLELNDDEWNYLVQLVVYFGKAMGSTASERAVGYDPVVRRVCGLAELAHKRSNALLQPVAFISQMVALFDSGEVGIYLPSVKELTGNNILISVYKKTVELCSKGKADV